MSWLSLITFFNVFRKIAISLVWPDLRQMLKIPEVSPGILLSDKTLSIAFLTNLFSNILKYGDKANSGYRP